MAEGCVLVLDVGKTNAKLSLWTRDGQRVGAVSRANADIETPDYRALDVAGIESWLRGALRDFAAAYTIAAIVPIAHGAATAIVADDCLAAPVMSYESELPASPDYERARDRFDESGSPRLPNGLNLGAQLHHLSAQIRGPARLMPYAQYWAWVLSGVAATEVSSLGCHTDLWRPHQHTYSYLSVERGWAERFAPMHKANAVLGLVRADLADDTGLPRDCIVYCGAHDSNAAFYGTRAHPILKDRDVTVISTGTWFVAMRAPHDDGAAFRTLSANRDTLINVGVDGQLIPSARFMGGREMEALIGAEDTPMRTPHFAREIAPLSMKDVLASGAMITPSFALGVGPFSNKNGRWIGGELHGAARRAAAGIYLALVVDTSLSLVGAHDAIVVEGRFADDMSFMRMLAALRPDSDVYAARAEDGIAYGALRLVNPDFVPNTELTKIAAVDADISAYVARWRQLANT